MTVTQVSTARKFATAVFAGVVALSLMLPTQLAFADYSVGDQSYSGEEDNSGEGAEGGTWAYTAEGQQMNLVDYVGEAIAATNQDLNIQLEGDNTVNGGIRVGGGDLTITGDENVDGEDKPSLTVDATAEQKESYEKSEYKDRDNGPYAEISASYNCYDAKTQKSNQVDGKGNITISDANVTFISGSGSIRAVGGDLTIKDSRIARGDGNNELTINDSGARKKGSDEQEDVTMLLVGSEIEATHVNSSAYLTIDNTNLLVTPSKTEQKSIDEGNYDKEGATPWLATAVRAIKGITLKGEENGTVEKYTYTSPDGSYTKTWYYLSTGDKYKVDLKATATPAYWGKNKGMPATGDATMSLIAMLSMAAMAAGALGVYSFRSRRAEGHHTK